MTLGVARLIRVRWGPPPEQNPCVAILVSTALEHAGLPPRDPYLAGGPLSLGKPGFIDALFERAVFFGVTTTRVPAPFRLPSVGDYLEFVRTSASPIVQILSRLNEAARQSAWNKIETKLRAFDTREGWEGPNPDHAPRRPFSHAPATAARHRSVRGCRIGLRQLVVQRVRG